jgi:ribulose-phosphate 3-epimerase
MWSRIKEEVQRCLDAGAPRLHVDIFDGVFLDSPLALTFGPQMVAAIRRCSAEAILDLHMCVDRPARYITPMKEAGGNTFIFQWESVKDEEDAIGKATAIANSVVNHGMECGISINPSTMVEDIFPLLESGLVAIVDVLSVEPGFGGQTFQEVAVEKVEKLFGFREAREAPLQFKILVDGGINNDTAKGLKKADILVAGTFLFRHQSMSNGIKELLSSFV